MQIVYNFFNDLESKDWITLIASLSAFFFSIASYLQKFNEGKLALRKQLTEVLEKLSQLNIDSATSRLKPEEYPNNYGGLLNDKRRFFVRQADFLIKKLNGFISPWEYSLVASAFEGIDDVNQAESYFKKAISSAVDSYDKGIAYRNFGRFLYLQGETCHDEARSNFKMAVDAFSAPNDRSVSYLLDTYFRWGQNELEWDNKAKAREYFQLAKKTCEKLANPMRLQHELDRISKFLSEKNIDILEDNGSDNHISLQQNQT